MELPKRVVVAFGASVLIALTVSVTVAEVANNIRGNEFFADDIPDVEVLDFPSWSDMGDLKSSIKQQSTAKPQPQQQQKPQSPQGCNCKGGQCLCCTGPLLNFFRQKACIKILYTPEDFAFDYSMLLNNRVLYQNRVSGKNPPPACISIPGINTLRVCVKFSNIYFAGRNIHMCMGMEGHWQYFELFSISFDCFKMGSDGISLLKPEDGGGVGVNGGVDAIIDSGDDIADYDENVVRSVTFDTDNNTRIIN